MSRITCHLATELQNTAKFLYFVPKIIIVIEETLYLFKHINKRMKYLAIILLFTILFSSCQSKNETTSVADNSMVKVDIVSFEKQSLPFITKEGDTLISLVDIKYPKLSGGNEAAITKINAFVATLPIKGIFSLTNPEENANAATAKTLAEATKNFLTEVAKMQKEQTDVLYTYHANGDTIYISPTIISLQFDESTYTGGAHDNYYSSLLNFDAQTGELLKLSDIVKDTVALKKMAETKFIAGEKQIGKENGYEFMMSDYFFADGKFSLPNNITITANGIRFLYNPYEVASFARGQIIFDIPWKELKGIVVEKYAKK